MSQQAIELVNVEKIFRNKAGEFPALKDINLNIKIGEFVSIIGKSGSGKSTLLNMMTGIDFPTSGEVLIGGTDLYAMNESKRSLWRGKNIGIVFQFFQLLPMLTLLENTILPMDYCNYLSKSERPKRALELLKQVKLDQHANKYPNAVSTGQQQSVAIARALATDPQIIIADEPTGNLDSQSAEVIINLFDWLSQQGKTIAMVTHDPSLTEKTDRTLIISDGELVNDVIVRALPLLTHKQMLEISKKTEHLSYQPGATILSQNQNVDYFFMVAGGKVEIVLKPRRCPDLTVATLGYGEFFGEIELIHGGNSIASVRAYSDGPVELVAIRRDIFISLLKNSPLTEDAIIRVVKSRLAENRSQDRRGCR